MESMSAFHSTNLFLCSRHHIPTNSLAPLSAYKPTHNPQFLQLLWRRASAWNISFFFTHNSGQFTFSTQLLTLNYLQFSLLSTIQFLWGQFGEFGMGSRDNSILVTHGRLRIKLTVWDQGIIPYWSLMGG